MQRQLAVGTGVTLGATLAMGGVAQAACNCTVNSLADPSDPVSISGLTISGGNSIFGGGIDAYNTALTVSDSVISGNNSSSHGGGITVDGGSLTVIGSTVSGNIGDRGSGIYTESGSGTP